MDPYVLNLHNLLAQTAVPDTNIIQQATAALNKDFYKSPKCIPALLEIIAKSSDQNIRQLAAVELRKRISQGESRLWTDSPQDVRILVKKGLLEVIVAETARNVRHSTARVISAIANIELPVGDWPSLFPFLQQACESPQAVHREVGIFVLYSILESVIEVLKAQTSTIFPLLGKLLNDPESDDVRITTVRALGTVAQYLENEDKSEIAIFRELLPRMFAVIRETVVANDEERARHGFDVIETLLVLEAPLLSRHIPDLVDFCLSIGKNPSTDDQIRQMALNALNWTIKYKKSKIQALNLAEPILQSLLPIGAEADPEDNDEDSPSRLAFRAVDALATVLPPQQVFPPLHKIVTEFMASQDPGLRKSAMMAFGVTIEGCSEFIRPHMKALWPLLDAGLSDGEPVVRKAACIAFACVCEWLEDECVERHAVLLPAILNLINDPESQGPACTALDAYLEIMENEIAQYLTLIMERLVHLLDSAPLSVKAIVTGAIGSAAHASKDGFRPYFSTTMTRLQPFLTLTKEGEELDLRGISTDAIGTIAEAVGKDAFRPYFDPMMINSFEAIDLGSARLKECSFLFFGVMAKVFEDEFAPYLPKVVPLLLESLKQSEGGDDLERLLNGAGSGAFASGEGSTSVLQVTEGDNGEDPDQPSLTVNSAIAIEKEIAADTIGSIFACTRGAFMPYLEDCVVELTDILGHYYEGIRKSALTSLFETIKTFYELSNQPMWEAGATLKVPLHEKVIQLIDAILPQILEIWDTEDDKGVVSQLCAGLSETIAKVGPGLILGPLKVICKNVALVLEGKSLCQQDPDANEEDEILEDAAEFDTVLISSASDVVGALASALGPEFAQLYGTFLPLLTRYTIRTRSNTERASAIGAIGEVITGMKQGITPFTDATLEVIGGALSDPDHEVQSNAAFATGVLIENTDADLSPKYLMILGALKPLFDLPQTTSYEGHARDNAAGAVARMIVKNAGAVPLDQVLPILFGALPLKNDLLENRSVYSTILYLFTNNPQTMMPHLDQLLPAFVAVLDPNAGDQQLGDLRPRLIELLQALNVSVPDKIAATGLNAFL